ncbi:hypothetical protein V8C34DRAFT_317658 [Trichoderma compactum]
MPSPWRESTWWSESRSLYTLLLNFWDGGATDPRDLVYALRGISSDLADKRDDLLFPDYEKPLEKLVYDVVQYFYDVDMGYILKRAPRLSSIRELVRNLPRLEMDICWYLAEIQDITKVAARCDKDGKVVHALLRCRWGEFKIDNEVLLSAAANLNGAKEVLEALWDYQNQLVITEEILIATANNLKSGHSAMRFLLSLKTQMTIKNLLEQKGNSPDVISELITAAGKIQDSFIKREIIENLLRQKGNSNDTISKCLTIATNIQPFGLMIIKDFVRKNPGFGISRDAVIVAMKNWPGYTDSLEVLCRYLPSLNPRRKQVA